MGHWHRRIAPPSKSRPLRCALLLRPTQSRQVPKAAGLIARHMLEGVDRVFFTNRGAGENEHAIRMARLRKARHKVLATIERATMGPKLAVRPPDGPRRRPSDNGSSGVLRSPRLPLRLPSDRLVRLRRTSHPGLVPLTDIVAASHMPHMATDASALR
jgi:hypothetical protein